MEPASILWYQPIAPIPEPRLDSEVEPLAARPMETEEANNAREHQRRKGH